MLVTIHDEGMLHTSPKSIRRISGFGLLFQLKLTSFSPKSKNKFFPKYHHPPTKHRIRTEQFLNILRRDDICLPYDS